MNVIARIGAMSLVLSGVARAEDDVIATDRPDFVESSQVVGAGRFQIELGVSKDEFDDNTDSVHTLTTPTLLRLGVSKNFELRLETDGRTVVETRSDDTETTIRGYSDVSLGFKWHIGDWSDSGAYPSVAALVHVDLDTGSSELRGVGARPSVRVVAEWELPADFSLGVMPGVVYDNDGEHRYTAGILAVTLGIPMGDKFHSFVEVAGAQIAHTENGGCIVTYDAGVTYLLTNSIQLDVSGSLRANDNSPDWSAGAGLSVKF